MSRLPFLLWLSPTAAAPGAVEPDQYAEAFTQFKANLLEQYQIRLRTKTANRLPINLTAKPTHFGTSPERAAIYFQKLTIESEDIATEIGRILDTHQRLLLIGDPGAGKTTILLFAAIHVLTETRDPKLPLLLNLATWDDQRDFAEWYAQSIAHTYSLSPVFVQALLQRNAVVPFFDGFDEVKEAHRDDCFRKMAAYFGDQHSKQLIVSSRKREYAEAQADAPVYAEIEVQPLSLAQIKQALFEHGQTQGGDLGLLRALDQDEWLAQAVETPFYLNTASFLFGKGERTLRDFGFKADDVEGRQAELVETFVAEQVPDGRDRKWLGFLAGKMEEEGFLVFELVKMQPRWGKNVRWYQEILGLCAGLLIGVSGGLLLGFFCGSLGGLFFGLISGLSSYLVFRFLSVKIDTEDIQTWHWRRFLKNWKRTLYSSFDLTLSFIALFISAFFLSPFISKIIGFLSVVIASVIYSEFKSSGTTSSFLLHIFTPYSRFTETFKNSILGLPYIILIVALSALLSTIWGSAYVWQQLVLKMQNPYSWLIIFIIGIGMFMIQLLNIGLCGHFILRLTLYLEHKLPLRLVTFLDRMTDQLIFEDNRRKVKGRKMRGATWRFRHKIFQDYFAKMPSTK